MDVENQPVPIRGVSEPNALLALEIADRMLAEIASVDDAKKIIDLAELARVYAKQAKLGTSAVNHATVIKVRAERELAAIVNEGQAKGEIASPSSFHGNAHAEATGREPSTLAELGIESGRLAEARVLREQFTDDELAVRQAAANAEDNVLSRGALLREARARRAEIQKGSEIQKKRVGMLYPVYEALEVLSGMAGASHERPTSLRSVTPMPAAEWHDRVPSYSRHHLDDVEMAYRWLGQLRAVMESEKSPASRADVVKVGRKPNPGWESIMTLAALGGGGGVYQSVAETLFEDFKPRTPAEFAEQIRSIPSEVIAEAVAISMGWLTDVVRELGYTLERDEAPVPASEPTVAKGVA